MLSVRTRVGSPLPVQCVKRLINGILPSGLFIQASEYKACLMIDKKQIKYDIYFSPRYVAY